MFVCFFLIGEEDCEFFDNAQSKITRIYLVVYTSLAKKPAIIHDLVTCGQWSKLLT